MPTKFSLQQLHSTRNAKKINIQCTGVIGISEAFVSILPPRLANITSGFSESSMTPNAMFTELNCFPHSVTKVASKPIKCYKKSFALKSPVIVGTTWISNFVHGRCIFCLLISRVHHVQNEQEPVWCQKFWLLLCIGSAEALKVGFITKDPLLICYA